PGGFRADSARSAAESIRDVSPLASGGTPHPVSELDASAHPGGLPPGPDQVLWDAQDRFLLAGRRLAPEEKAKRRQPPEDLWRRMVRLAEEARFPEAEEVFLYKFHGLFYASSVENAYMCRLRLAAGQITAHQLRGIAALAERFAHP